MFNKSVFLSLVTFLITSTNIDSIGFSANPDLIKQLKIAYANIDYWVKQRAIGVQTKSWITYQYYSKYSECDHVYEHQLIPVTHVSYHYDFANQAAQSSFDKYSDLSTQLANRRLLNNFSTGCVLGAITALCQQKLGHKISNKHSLIALFASIIGVYTLEYDPKSDLPSYDLLALEQHPAAGKTSTIVSNTLLASVFAIASYLTTRGLLCS